MARFLLICLAGGVGLLLSLPYLAPFFIFRPAPLSPPEPAAWGLAGARQISFAAPDGSRLTGWWLAPPGPAAPVILLVHGRSANISTRATIAKRLAADGCGILLFDYRGYGQSTGQPSEAGINEDADAAYRWLRSAGVAPGRIVILGQSLGNAPAAALAAERASGGLILVSPYTSLPGVVADRLTWLPIAALPWPRNRFDVAVRLARVSVPIALVASRADGLVPLRNTRRLAKMLRRPVRWVVDRNAAHDGLLSSVARSGVLTRLVYDLAGDPGATAPRRWRAATASPAAALSRS